MLPLRRDHCDWVQVSGKFFLVRERELTHEALLGWWQEDMDILQATWQALKNYIEWAGWIGVLVNDAPQIMGKCLTCLIGQGPVPRTSTPGAQGRG